LLTAPELPGSGGSSCSPPSFLGGRGGGVVRLVVGDTLTVDGLISANAVNYTLGSGNPGYASGGGSGGSIYLTCATFSGTTSGLIRAEGSSGDPSDTISGGAGNGAGGRIAVYYSGLAPAHAVRFRASAGLVGWRSNDWDSAWMHAAQMGTLYLPDTALLAPIMENEQFRNVRIFFPTNAWSVDSLTLNNCGFIFGDEGFRLTVTNGLTLNNGMLGAGALNGSNGAQIAVGQNLTMTNQSRLYVFSGQTNNATDCGAWVGVTGVVIVASNSWICPFAHLTNGGAMKLTAASLAILPGGGINADAKGFGYDGGPGKGEPHGSGYAGGAGYGGRGGRGYFGLAGTNCGSASSPLMPGSGGGSFQTAYPRTRGGYGGGVVRIETTGGVTVDGTLAANGGNGDYAAGGGAGGGILIQCAAFGGGSSGLIQAQGGAGQNSGMPSVSGGGGGGRIAVAYTGLTGQPTVRFSTLPGTGYNFATPGDSRAAQMGTLYFNDTGLLTNTITTLSGYVLVSGFTTWAPSSLTISNAALGFVDGFQLNVGGDLRVAGTNGMLILGTNSLCTCASLTLTTNGQMWVYGAPTNGTPGAYGALVSVGGLLSVGGNTWIYPYTDRTNGGAPLFRSGRLFIEAGGGFNADAAGLQDATGPGRGTNAPAGWAGGAGYGGQGGNGSSTVGGPAYGSSNAPILPGSGGGNYNYIANPEFRYRGGCGGGVIRIEVDNEAVINGTLRAYGESCRYAAGSGAGGSIFVAAGGHVDTSSDSTIAAHGAAVEAGSPSSGGGGGGRVAIWYRVPDNERQRIFNGNMARVVVTSAYARVLSAPTALGGTGYQNGTNGTVVYLTVTPNPGTIISLW
jgi:hypothetical protein